MLFGVCVLFVFVETYFSRIIEFLSTRLSNVRSRGLAKDSDWYLGQRSSLFLMLMLGCFFFLSVSVLMSTEGWGTMNATCFTTALMITLAFVDQEVTSWEGKAAFVAEGKQVSNRVSSNLRRTSVPSVAVSPCVCQSACVCLSSCLSLSLSLWASLFPYAFPCSLSFSQTFYHSVPFLVPASSRWFEVTPWSCCREGGFLPVQRTGHCPAEGQTCIPTRAS